MTNPRLQVFSETLRATASRLQSAVDRIEALSNGSPDLDADQQDALILNLERAAWAALELGNAWVYELRLGVPRKPTDVFELIHSHQGWIDPEQTRKLRYLAEYRHLSSRDPAGLDWNYLLGDLGPDLALFREWEKIAYRSRDTSMTTRSADLPGSPRSR